MSSSLASKSPWMPEFSPQVAAQMHIERVSLYKGDLRRSRFWDLVLTVTSYSDNVQLIQFTGVLSYFWSTHKPISKLHSTSFGPCYTVLSNVDPWGLLYTVEDIAHYQTQNERELTLFTPI